MIATDKIVVEVQDRDNPTKFTSLDKWQAYEITNSADGSAGNFNLIPTPTPDVHNLFLSGGQIVRISCNGAPQLTGLTDERETASAAGPGSSITVTGRDMAGLLMDSAAPRKSLKGKTLATLANELIEPWQPTYIAGVVADTGPSFYRMVAGGRGTYKRLKFSKNSVDLITDWSSALGAALSPGSVQLRSGSTKLRLGAKSSPYYRGIDQDRVRVTRVKAGERIWSVLDRFAKQVACIMYMNSEAFLVIGRPTYNRFPYPKLVYKPDGSGNVNSASLSVNVADRFATYEFTSQGRKRTADKGKAVNHAVSIRDPSPAFWTLQVDGSLAARLPKPTVIEVKRGCTDQKLLRRLARGTVELAAIKSYKYRVEVPGHEASTGLLWAPDAAVEVEDTKNGVSGEHWIMSRSFHKGVDGGTKTLLDLVPANVWLALDHDTVSDQAWDEAARFLIDW